MTRLGDPARSDVSTKCLGVEQVDEVVAATDRQPPSVGAELGRLEPVTIEDVDLLAAVEIEDHDPFPL